MKGNHIILNSMMQGLLYLQYYISISNIFCHHGNGCKLNTGVTVSDGLNLKASDGSKISGQEC